MDARPDENPTLSALRADADRLWHEGRFEEAARRYGEAAAQSADPAPFLAWQGHALRAAGKTEAAVEAYARAGAASPADASMHRHRGHALRATGRHREALQAYAFAVALETGATQGATAEAAIRALESESPDFPEPPPLRHPWCGPRSPRRSSTIR